MITNSVDIPPQFVSNAESRTNIQNVMSAQQNVQTVKVTTSKSCPRWIQEQAIIKLKLTYSIIFPPEAHKQVLNNDSNLYDQAASAQHTEQTSQYSDHQVSPTPLSSLEISPPSTMPTNTSYHSSKPVTTPSLPEESMKQTRTTEPVIHHLDLLHSTPALQHATQNRP